MRGHTELLTAYSAWKSSKSFWKPFKRQPQEANSGESLKKIGL